MAANDYFFKYIMFGASGAGKTSIVQRFCHGTFEGGAHKATIGFDFLTKNLSIHGKNIELEIWDTAGQEQYRAVTKMYYKDVHGVLLVYDTTDSSSFDWARFWLDDLDMHGSKLEKRVLVGSKADLVTTREISNYDAKSFASERKLEYIECSAKENKGINEAFEILINKSIEEYNANPNFRKILAKTTTVSIGPPISKEDEMHRNQTYKLNKERVDAKKKKKCC